jgi:hypothetical protein
MNKSITTVALNTKSLDAREACVTLHKYEGQRVRVTFLTKKVQPDRSHVRVIEFVPHFQYNATLGIVSTQSGKRMVATKAHRDMITVMEIDGESVKPRTVNLSKVISIVPVAA